jgi:hypothetical protein
MTLRATAALERLTQISGQITGSKSAKDKLLQKNADDVSSYNKDVHPLHTTRNAY